MTVASNTPYDQYSATVSQTVFNYTFEIVEQTDILVYQRGENDTPDDVADLLVLNVDYTVAGAGNENGGTITLTTGATLNDVVTLKQNVPVERDTSFTNGGVLRAQDLNNEYDAQMLTQQVTRFNEENRMLRYWDSAILEDPRDLILPVLDPRDAWRMNAAGTAIETFVVPDGDLAPGDATYLIQTANAFLPNAQVMGSLATGFVFNTTTTGVQSTRVFQGTANQLGVTNGNGAAGNPTYFIVDNPVLPGNEGTVLPKGTTAQRPGSPTEGELRYNETLNNIELYDGTDWITFSDGGVVDTVSGTANQIDIDATDPQNLIASLSATLDFPGTFTAQGTTAIDAINNDNTLAGASATTLSTDLALKTYIDNRTDLHYMEAVLAASTGNFASTYDNGTAGVGATLTATSNGAFSQDGEAGVLNGRYLQKDQTNTFENGIYTLSQVGDGSNPAILTRATDFDEADEIDPGDIVPVLNGTVNGSTAWIQTAIVNTVGTDAILWSQWTADFSNVVTITGAQTITGVKTFDANVILGNGSTLDLNGTTAIDGFIDDDTFATASATTGATSESIKAYVDAQSAGTLESVQVFTASGTWNKPAGINTVVVEVLGGGSGGGGTAGATGEVGVGGSGGAGGYAKKLIDVSAIASETVTVGAGGAGGAAGNNAGAAGGTTSFGAHCSATGGGATGALGPSATLPRIAQSNGNPGGGVGGDINILENNESRGVATANSAMSAPGASSVYGGGAVPRTANTSGAANGANAATNSGGGGSGGVTINTTSSAAGGDGADGLLIVWEYS